MNQPINNGLRGYSSREHDQEHSTEDASRDESHAISQSFIDLSRLPDYLIAQGLVETETTFGPDDTETITYHLTDKGLELLGKLL